MDALYTVSAVLLIVGASLADSNTLIPTIVCIGVAGALVAINRIVFRERLHDETRKEW